jgi:hypothetical protein
MPFNIVNKQTVWYYKDHVREPAPLRYVVCRLLYLQLLSLSLSIVFWPISMCTPQPLFPSDIFSLFKIAAFCDVVI